MWVEAGEYILVYKRDDPFRDIELFMLAQAQDVMQEPLVVIIDGEVQHLYGMCFVEMWED